METFKGWDSGARASKSFYSKIKNYHFFGSEPPNELSPKYVVFTQLIWLKSREVGIGCARGIRYPYWFYVVADYYPAGNILGEYAVNVLKP